MNYHKLIKQYQPETKKDGAIQRAMLQFIEKNKDDVLTRENTMAHFTASSVILNDNFTKILMIHHKIYDTWTWQGGHADGEKNLLKVALKEAFEETGLHHLTVLKIDENPVVRLDILPVKEHMKNGEFITSHMHLNAAYVFRASEKEMLRQNQKETNGIQWVLIDEIETYAKEPDITPIYHELIQLAEESILASRG